MISFHFIFTNEEDIDFFRVTANNAALIISNHVEMKYYQDRYSDFYSTLLKQETLSFSPYSTYIKSVINSYSDKREQIVKKLETILSLDDNGISPVFLCNYCGERLDKYNLSLDHYLPESIYPWYAIKISNLVPACGRCNENIKLQKEFIPKILPKKRFRYPYKNGKEKFVLSVELKLREIDVLKRRIHFSLNVIDDSLSPEQVEMFDLADRITVKIHKKAQEILEKYEAYKKECNCLESVQELITTSCYEKAKSSYRNCEIHEYLVYSFFSDKRNLFHYEYALSLV